MILSPPRHHQITRLCTSLVVLNPRSYAVCVCCMVVATEKLRTMEMQYPTDVRSPLFVQTFVACVAIAMDPVILVRLLRSRLVTTPFYPRKSLSITSMPGQDAFPPRTLRSRASSTDTNASTRKKRVRYLKTSFI